MSEYCRNVIVSVYDLLPHPPPLLFFLIEIINFDKTQFILLIISWGYSMGQISPSFMTFKVCRLYLGVLGQPESKWKLFEKFLLVKKNRTSTEIS